jgi:hypothetical protein
MTELLIVICSFSFVHGVGFVACGNSPRCPTAGALSRAALTYGAMRSDGQKAGDIHCMQAWAGQSAGLARSEQAGELVRKFWAEARALLA